MRALSPRPTGHRDLTHLVLEMLWNDEYEGDRYGDDDEIVRMIQLSGMIGRDPELAEV